MSSTLWQKRKYRANITYMIDQFIREYDISKANISVLKDAGIINDDEYFRLYNAPKLAREIEIGKMQGANPEIARIISGGIESARKFLFDANDIQDSEVLAINNDAVVVVRHSPLLNLNASEHVRFRMSGEYSSYYRLAGLDLFYLIDVVHKREALDIKGLGDSAFALHAPFMIDLLKELFYIAQFQGSKNAIFLLNTVHPNYIERRLPLGFYREFNAQSMFRITRSLSPFAAYYMDNPTRYELPMIDISYNEKILRDLIALYGSIYFRTKR